jgi:hypothetical protein
MKQNYLIGMVMIAFGLYLMLVKLNVIIAFDFILLIALAFIGGYVYRKSSGDQGAGGLLLVGNILTGVYLSNHLPVWLSGVDFLSDLGTIFYIGLAFLLTWLIENGFDNFNRKRQHGFLIIGSVMTLVGCYSVLLDAFNISPSIIRAFMFPVILIVIGAGILYKNQRHKIL